MVSGKQGWSEADAERRARGEREYAEALRLYNNGRYDAAITKFESARRLARELGEDEAEASSLNDMGACHFMARRYDQALAAYRRALLIRHKIGGKAAIADTVENMAQTHRAAGDLEAAVARLDQAASLARALGDGPREARALSDAGACLADLGRPTHALERLDQAISIFEMDGGDALHLAIALNNKGKALDELWRLSSALDCFTRALKIFEDRRDIERTGRILSSLGENRRRAGLVTDALAYLERALQVQRDSGDRVGEGGTLNNLALAYLNLGRPQEALDYLWRSLDARRQTRDRLGEARTFNTLGMVYRDVLDQASQALDYYDRALEIARQSHDEYGLGIILTNKGLALRSLADFAQARQCFEEALSIRRRAGDRGGEARCLDNLGRLSSDAGQPAQALEYHSRALGIERELKNRRGQAATLSGIAAALLMLGSVSEASSRYREVLRIQREIGDRTSEPATLQSLAYTSRLLGQAEEAVRYFEEAIGCFEAIQAAFVTDEVRAAYQEAMYGAYRGLVEVLLDEYKQHPEQSRLVEEAFNVAERGRARALLYMLRDAELASAEGANPTPTAEERALFHRIGATVLQLQESTRAEPDSAEVRRLNAELRMLEERYEMIQSRLRQSHPWYATLAQPRPAELAEVQARLATIGGTLFEYVLGRRKSWLFVVTSARVRVFDLPDEATVERQVAALVSAARQRNTSPPTESHTLFQMLIAPARELLTTPRLLIASDGALHYLPFELLLAGETSKPWTADDRGLPYLVRSHALSYVASAASLLLHTEKSRTPRPEKEFIGIAPVVFRHAASRFTQAERRGWAAGPLPSTADEVTAIREQFPEEAGVAMLRESATKQALREKAPGFRYVHLATHGVVNESRPLFSGLLFTPESPKDSGYISAAEVLTLPLAAEMVVLSACETGLGRLVRGEGLIGLTRTFMCAGADSLVVSLWQVSDQATAELMKTFYAFLKQGVEKAEALRRAKESLLVGSDPNQGGRDWSGPFFWAPFVLVE